MIGCPLKAYSVSGGSTQSSMQITDVCAKQRGDKLENVPLPECQQIGHQTTTRQGGEEVG